VTFYDAWLPLLGIKRLFDGEWTTYDCQAK
jgi:hypothetical protein